ncbi:hypothetical protein KKB84_03160 [bacterium]|nr:hypothetical protein [bacterium]
MATEKNSLDTRLLLEALVGLKNGDFSVRLPVDWAGVDGKIADIFNEEVTFYEYSNLGR